jgi:predicted regulator of Ras-like GTPase activity (Roadblock/LC7/MglB family)
VNEAERESPTEGDALTSFADTEFGRVLVELVGVVPGALGAVLSDGEGWPIDYAHDATRLDGLELQIVGAQLGLPLARAHETCVRRDVGPRDSVLLECERGALLGALVEARERSVLVLVLAPHASLGRAIVQFDRARAAIEALLR